MKDSLFVGLIRIKSDTLDGTAIERSPPPHPDPLPRGEGTAAAVSCWFHVRTANAAQGYSKSRKAVLPLQWGEGRGKQNVLCHSDASLSQKAAIAQVRTRPLRTTSFLKLKYVVLVAIVFVPLLASAAEANT